MLTDSTGCVQRHYAQRLTGIALCTAIVEVYVFMHVCNTYIHTHVIHTHTHTHTHKDMYVFMYAHVCTYMYYVLISPLPSKHMGEKIIFTSRERLNKGPPL
jgi:hypothetical protein